MDRVLIVDKPAAMTSHDVVERVRRSSRQKKVGHTGTLDPSATGVLVLLTGRATKLAQFLLDADKEYRGYLILGQSTDTQDADGTVISEGDYGNVTEEALRASFGKLVGEIDQIPPMVSAIKRSGRPLYVLARKGIVVEREPRRVFVERLELLGFAPPRVEFEVACSKGTYVRTLASDIGADLGCGAHLGKLARMRVGPFTAEDAISLEKLERVGPDIASVGFSMFAALSDLPTIRVSPRQAELVEEGGSLYLDATAADAGTEEGQLVRMSANGVDLLAVGKILGSDTEDSDRRLSVRPIRVFADLHEGARREQSRNS